MRFLRSLILLVTQLHEEIIKLNTDDYIRNGNSIGRAIGNTGVNSA